MTTTEEERANKLNYEIDSSDDDEGPGWAEAQAIINRLLSLDSPELTEKMVELLIQDGSIEFMLEYITRLNPDVSLPENYIPGTELPSRKRNYDMQSLKMSYTCMDLLCGANKNVARILQNKFRNIVVKIFDIFQYNSDGNFHHFRKVFENLLRFKPIEILDTILFPRGDEPPLVLSMLDFLDESPVSAALGTILFFPLKLSTSEIERKKRINHFLESQQLIRRIVRRIGYSDNQSAAAADFLVRVIDECTRIESSEVITSSMRNLNDSIVEWVFEIITSHNPKVGNTQRLGCLNVLSALLIKSGPKEFEIPVSTSNMYAPSIQKTPNGLHELNAPTKRKVIEQFGNIHTVLHNDAYMGKKQPGKKEPFPAMRLAALEVMYEAIKDVDDIKEALERLPASFWKMTVSWFFDFKFNNVYHSVFYKLIVAAIRSNHGPTLKNIFPNTKFLGRMIEHYLDQGSSGCRGFILLICNILRLTNDSQKPTEYIPSMLNSHHAWNNFLPTLRQDTLNQVSLQIQEDPTFTRPMPHTGPQTIPQEEDDMLSFLARVLKSGDIDIGSQFAYTLGFTGNTLEDDDDEIEVNTEIKKKKKKKNKNKKSDKIEIHHSSENGEATRVPGYMQPPPYGS